MLLSEVIPASPVSHVGLVVSEPGQALLEASDREERGRTRPTRGGQGHSSVSLGLGNQTDLPLPSSMVLRKHSPFLLSASVSFSLK